MDVGASCVWYAQCGEPLALRGGILDGADAYGVLPSQGEEATQTNDGCRIALRRGCARPSRSLRTGAYAPRRLPQLFMVWEERSSERALKASMRSYSP